MAVDANTLTSSVSSQLNAETIGQFINQQFLPGLLSGNPLYVVATGIVLLIVLAVVFKVTLWVLALVKRILLFLIVLGAGALFFIKFGDRLQTLSVQRLSTETLLLGIAGITLFIIALFISILSLRAHAKRVPVQESASPAQQPPFQPTMAQPPRMLTTQALVSQFRNDRSLLAVISYVIIAEFGIFSSKTIAAPNPNVGMMFAAIFLGAALVFIKVSYNNYVKGLVHLIVACIFAAGLSILLGHYWASIPLEVLLSVEYFRTSALVAFITGIAVSLLMGQKS
jgi:hypothetical protein